MKLIFTCLLLLTLFSPINGSIADMINRWNRMSAEEQCYSCVNIVYGVLLNDNKTIGGQAREMVIENNFCPWLGEVIYDDREAMDVEQCTSIVVPIMKFFYPVYYYSHRIIRNWYCVPLCGDSGESYCKEQNFC